MTGNRLSDRQVEQLLKRALKERSAISEEIRFEFVRFATARTAYDRTLYGQKLERLLDVYARDEAG